MLSRAALIQRQRRWAEARSLRVDDRHYVDHYESNLFQAMSPKALQAFQRGSGSELLPSDRRPAKMAALHSSSALAVNAFDYWMDKPLDRVAGALDLGRVPARFDFEAQFPTGLGGIPPNLDVAFHFDNGAVLGVESKFSEWLARKRQHKAPFRPRYFPANGPLWSAQGLPAVQALAEDIQSHREHFQHLDATQLLKHTLGLAVAVRGAPDLLYLYYDWPGPESELHRAEIERFSRRLKADMSFRAMTYQRFFELLLPTLTAEDAPYTGYVKERYC